MELGGAKIGDKVLVNHANKSIIRGVLKEVKTFGIEISIYAYKNPDHPRFIPFHRIDGISLDDTDENVTPIRR